MKFTENYAPFEVRITYRGGEINGKLDTDIQDVAEQFGGEDFGAGFFFTTGERDLQFGFNKAHGARLLRKRVKSWKHFKRLKGKVKVVEKKPWLDFFEKEL